MTFKELLAENNPYLTHEDIEHRVNGRCPDDYFPIAGTPFIKDGHCHFNGVRMKNCADCWNRQIHDHPTKEETT